MKKIFLILVIVLFQSPMFVHASWEWTQPSEGSQNISLQADTSAEISTTSDLIINEVVITDIKEGKAYVELYNSTDKTLILEGWSLSQNTPISLTAESLSSHHYRSFDVMLDFTSDHALHLIDPEGDVQDVFSLSAIRGKKNWFSWSRFCEQENVQLCFWEEGKPTKNETNEYLPLSAGKQERDRQLVLTASHPEAEIYVAYRPSEEGSMPEKYEHPIDFPQEPLIFFATLHGRVSPLYLYVSDNKRAEVEGRIVFSEIFPNPKGKDDGKEWVELQILQKNTDMSDLFMIYKRDTQCIEGGSKECMSLADIANDQSYALIDPLSVPLSNKNAYLAVIDSYGNLYAEVNLPPESAKENQSYAWNEKEEKYIWTTHTTPGKSNIFSNQEFSKKQPLKKTPTTTGKKQETKAKKVASSLSNTLPKLVAQLPMPQKIDFTLEKDISQETHSLSPIPEKELILNTSFTPEEKEKNAFQIVFALFSGMLSTVAGCIFLKF